MGSQRTPEASNPVEEPTGAPAVTHSRLVRKIVRLEARAQRHLTRYEHALAVATRAKGHAHVLLDQAYAIECVLTGTQCGELYRARGAAMRSEATAHSVASDRPAVTSSS